MTLASLAPAIDTLLAAAAVGPPREASPRTGRFAILEQLRADGITHIFGNPGTVEQGFLDALWDFPDLKYVLTLQETVALLVGDGYARATQKPTVVQIHSSPGLGNTIGALYQAMRGHAPLVVIGGDLFLRGERAFQDDTLALDASEARQREGDRVGAGTKIDD